jgi:hypothetical protein
LILIHKEGGLGAITEVERRKREEGCPPLVNSLPEVLSELEGFRELPENPSRMPGGESLRRREGEKVPTAV